MRIAYVNAGYQQNHTGGGFVHIEQFISNAVSFGHDIWTYTGNHHLQVHQIPTNHLAHIRTMRQMDVLYVRVESNFPEVCKWALPPKRLLYGLPIVVWEFNTTPDHGKLRGKSEVQVQKTVQLFKRYGRGCDLAICMTEDLADYVRRQLEIQRILIVPNGSDPDLFSPDVPIKTRMTSFQEKFNILWIESGKETWHDLNMLREAATKLLQENPEENICFHIIGPDLIGKMGEMPGNVFYWGPEFYRKLPGWLAGMDVGLSLYIPGPSDVATPLKVFDYLASGLPVVSTPLPFMVALNKQMDCPDLIIPSGDFNTLAEVLVKLASDKDRVKKLGLTGRQMVIEKYNWRRSVKETLDEMESILKEKRGN